MGEMKTSELKWPWEGNTSQHSDLSLCSVGTNLVLVVRGLWCMMSRMRCHWGLPDDWLELLQAPFYSSKWKEGGCLLYRGDAEQTCLGIRFFHPNSCWESSNEKYVWKNLEFLSTWLQTWLQAIKTWNVLGVLPRPVYMQHWQFGGFVTWGFFRLFYLQVYFNSKFQRTVRFLSFKICMNVHVFPRFQARYQCLSELYNYLIEIIKHRYKYKDIISIKGLYL